MGTCCTMVSRMKISSCVQDGLNLSATYNVAVMYHHGLHVKRNTRMALVREVAYRVLSPFDSTEYGDEYLALTPGDAVYVKEKSANMSDEYEGVYRPNQAEPSPTPQAMVVASDGTAVASQPSVPSASM